MSSKLDERMTAYYLTEIINQAGMAELGIVSLQAALSTLNAHVVPMAFQAAQSVLTAGAQISKLLYTVKRPDWSESRHAWAKERARVLRSITKPSALLQSRAVRNAIEHFDERLDALLFEHPTAAIVDQNVAPQPPAGSTVLRNLDPDTHVVSVLDVTVSLPDLWEAIFEVQERAVAWLQEHHRPVPFALRR